LSTFIVLPTYNESENIVQLVPQLLALPAEGLNVLIVDDNSPDGTGQIADRLSADHAGRVAVIHRAGKLGLGTAYLAGFRRAFELNASHILTMDADFSHHPRYIPALLARGASADLVIGSRYVGGGGMDAPLVRRLLSRFANLTAHTFLGLKARDVTAGFRLYRREALASIPLDRIFSSGYSFLIEMLFLVEQRGWRVAEVPIRYADRTMGKSKISRNEVYKAWYTVARLTYRRLRGR
jgi:dolichol-phosphate mannosyltransferase